jgi:hypothetical protein
MQVCGRNFSPEIIGRIQTTVDAEPDITRRELSRRICGWLDWHSLGGKQKDMGCRKALAELNRRGVISLPELTRTYSFQQPSTNRKEPKFRLPAGIHCPLAELGQVEIVPVSSSRHENSGIWNEMMEGFHYLGKGPLCGAQMRYLVHSSVCGWLGALSFSAGTWHLEERDNWIGWNAAARQAHLQKVVCNSRFLILPTVEVPNLASHILSQCLKRLADDWQEYYGYRPVLVETFVEPGRFLGTSYQAANWIRVGQTAGRRTPSMNPGVSDGPKDIYLYTLHRNWKSILCAVPVIPLGHGVRREEPKDWVELEFGTVELYDNRLRNRLYTITRDFFARPGAQVPQACNGAPEKMRAAYRFFANPEVSMDILLKPHVEATVERVRQYPVVLAVQDTSTLNYTTPYTTDPASGLGPINNSSNVSKGLLLHDTMGFSVDGVPLGLLNVQCWARDPNDTGKRYKRKNLPIEEKESMKWLNSYRSVAQLQKLCPETMFVSVGDREADVYELFAEAQKDPYGPKLLIRTERARSRSVKNGTSEGTSAEDISPLWEKMENEPLAGHQNVYVPHNGSRPARTAKVAISFAEVTLKPPKDRKLPPVSLWVVYVREVEHGPDVESPLEWMLLTTVETETFEDACERITWYIRRWLIEVYHRTLKSGCRILDRRLDNADRLEACLAIDMVVAWRIYQLTKQGRETPDVPCDVFLSEDEWQALCAYVTRKPPPEQPPSLRTAVRMIASLGGFPGRKCDGEPGTTTMWRGLQRLADITLGFTLGKSGLFSGLNLNSILAGPP